MKAINIFGSKLEMLMGGADMYVHAYIMNESRHAFIYLKVDTQYMSRDPTIYIPT